MPPETETETNQTETQGTQEQNEGSTQESNTTVDIDWGNVIPAELQEKDTFKNILASENPGVELAKQLDSAQELIGKKSVLPGEDASDEDWAKFVESIRPESADKYELPKLDLGEDKKEIQEYIETTLDQDFTKKVMNKMHELGVPKRIADPLSAWYLNEFAGIAEETFKSHRTAELELHSHFDALTKTHFGHDESKTLKAGKEFINELVPKELHKYMDGLPNEALLMFAAAGVQHAEKYKSQDNFKPGTTTSTGTETLAGVDTRMNELMASEAYQKTMHPQHEAVLTEVRELSKQKAALLKAAK